MTSKSRQSSDVSPATKHPAPQNTFPVDLDKVSLQQALRDFEIANARVLDLTQRLIESEKRRKELENELHQLRLQPRPGAAAGESPASQPALELARWAFRKSKSLAKRLLERAP